MTIRRTPLKVAVIGFALRELCRAVIRIADALDPAGSAPGWTPLPKPLTVPAAWVEMEGQR